LSFGAAAVQWLCPPQSKILLGHIQRRTTVVILPWTSDQLVTETSTSLHTTQHNRQKSIPPAEFELKISAGERPQTYALDRAVNGRRHLHNTKKCIFYRPGIALPVRNTKGVILFCWTVAVYPMKKAKYTHTHTQSATLHRSLC